MKRSSIYLIELTDFKRDYLTYYPFIIWNCFGHRITNYNISHIECTYGKIKATWKCDSIEDAEEWREEILKMRGQEDLI